MAIKFSDLSKTTRSTVVDVDGQPLVIVYKPNAMSAKAQLLGGRLVHISETVKAGGEVTAEDVYAAINDLIQVLLDLMVSWDLVDDDGVVIPVNREWLSRLPMEMLSAIFRSFSEAESPNEKSAEG